MLQVIVIALLVGFGFVLVGEKAEPAKVVIESLNEVMVKVMDMIIKLSPIGVFCLITPLVAENGAVVIGSLAAVIGVALIAGVDIIFDMGRTVCNITGDAACSCVVNALEEKKEARRAAKKAE